MKRILSTIVLFVLLVLTVVALAQMDSGDTSALNTKQSEISHATN